MVNQQGDCGCAVVWFVENKVEKWGGVGERKGKKNPSNALERYSENIHCCLP